MGQRHETDHISFSSREHKCTGMIWSLLLYLATPVEEDYFNNIILVSYKETLRRKWLWSSSCCPDEGKADPERAENLAKHFLCETLLCSILPCSHHFFPSSWVGFSSP